MKACTVRLCIVTDHVFYPLEMCVDKRRRESVNFQGIGCCRAMINPIVVNVLLEDQAPDVYTKERKDSQYYVLGS